MIAVGGVGCEKYGLIRCGFQDAQVEQGGRRDVGM
jgi:hypothetical protein